MNPTKKMKILTERPHLRNPSINIMMKASVLFPFDSLKFEESIHKLREIHPLLSSVIKTDENGDAYYQFFEVEKNDFIIIENSTWHTTAESEKNHYFNLTTESLVRYFVFPKQESFDVLIVAHHLVGDGLAVFNILKDLVLVYFNTEIPYHQQRLIQGKSDFPQSARSSIMMSLLIKKWNSDWKSNTNIYSQNEFKKLHSRFNQENESRILTANIPYNQLLELKRKCIKNEVSINDAITTALILAQQKHHPKHMNQKQEIAIPINIRNDLAFNPKDSLGNFASAITIKIKLDDTGDFWESVRLVRKAILKKTSSDKKKWLIMNLYSEMDPNLIDSLYFSTYGNSKNETASKVATSLGLTDDPQSTGLSNLGKVSLNNYIGNKYLKDCFFFPPKVPNAGITIGVITIKDTLSFGLTFDDKYIGFASTKLIVKNMIDSLTRE